MTPDELARKGLPMWCDGCRAVGAIHCAHPDECGNMLSATAAADSWKAWINDLPLEGFDAGLGRLQDFISALVALIDVPQPALTPAPVAPDVAGLIKRLDGVHEWGYRDPVVGGFIEDFTPYKAAAALRAMPAGLQSAPADLDAVRAMARHIRTRDGYLHPIEIAVSDHAREVVFLGQGDFPTVGAIAANVRVDMDNAADMLEALAADLAATRAALAEAQGEVERVRVEAWNAAIKVAMEEAEEHKHFAKGIECLPECIAALALKGPAHDR